MASVPLLLANIKTGDAQHTFASALTAITHFTVGVNGGKMVSATASSNDTSSKIIRVYYTYLAVDYNICTTLVPALSGNDPSGVVAGVDLLTLAIGWPIDNDGQKYRFLPPGAVVKSVPISGASAGKTIDVHIDAAEF